MNGNIRLIGILVLGMLVLASVQVVGAQQTWYFCADEIMSKTHTPGSYVVCKDGSPKWWYVDEPAECDLTIGAGSWTVHIYHDTADESYEYDGTITADIYKVADGTKIHIATGSESPTEGGTDTTITCPMGSGVDFATGEKFAVRISWSPTSEKPTDPLYVYYSATKPSTLTSPSSDPGYPVPELITLVLLSTGLLTLAGYVLLTKRRD
jgi:hypothetical protein